MRTKGNPMLWWWECILVQQLWKTLRRFLKKLKNRITVWSSNPTSAYIIKGNENMISKSYLYSHAYCNIIDNIWVLISICEWWMKKKWCIYIVEYYSVMTKKEILFAKTWVDLKSVMLNEMKLTEKDKYSITYNVYLKKRNP